jgi:hypothetical protein
MTTPRKALQLNLAAAACLLLLCSGLSSRPQPDAAPPTTDAWLEAKAACIFPLTSPPPLDSQAAFMTALLGGLQRLAVMPAGASALSGDATAYPALRSLRIDLTNAVEDDTHKPPKVNWHYVPHPGVHVDRLEVTARPLIIEGAKVQYDLTAGDADLNMAQDRKHRPLLMLMGAQDGHFSIAAAHGDMETLCLAAARQFAVKYGFSVSSVDMELTAPTVRTLDVKLTVTLDGRMGGTLNFTGRLTVAPDLTATASNLSCHGDGVGGVLISSMLESGLTFYNGKTKPLVSFPFDGMELRDVSFHTGGDLHIDADFSKRG